MSTEIDNKKNLESGNDKPPYFNEYDQKLLEEGITDRIPLDDNTQFRSATASENGEGVGGWTTIPKAMIDELRRHPGEFNVHSSYLCFIDRNGNPSVAGDSPKNRKALKDAHYSQDTSLSIPFVNGEELSQFQTDPSGERLSDKLKRIGAIARRDWEEAERAARSNETTDSTSA